jgi:hypothetical protein
MSPKPYMGQVADRPASVSKKMRGNTYTYLLGCHTLQIAVGANV